MAQDTHKVYALFDPDDFMCGYVGITTQELDKRLTQHISEVSKGGGGAKKHEWLLDILDSGAFPIIVELDRCGEDEWPAREQYWINSFRSRGYELTNTTDGGIGQPGLQHTAETREKISASMKAYKAQDH